MKEFRDAHAHATGNERNKFLIPLLLGEISLEELDADLKFFLKKKTYLDCKNVVIMHPVNLK